MESLQVNEIFVTIIQSIGLFIDAQISEQMATK